MKRIGVIAACGVKLYKSITIFRIHVSGNQYGHVRGPPANHLFTTSTSSDWKWLHSNDK